MLVQVPSLMQSSALPIHWASADAMLLVKADFSALRRRTPSSRRLLSETVTARVLCDLFTQSEGQGPISPCKRGGGNGTLKEEEIDL